MAGYKGSTFDDRRTAAAEAKRALLEKFKTRPTEDDPRVQQLREERRAINEAREARALIRAKERELEQARQAELARQRQAEEEARLLEEIRLAEEARLAEQDLKAQQKAARDAKYAARKARRR